MSSLLIAVLSIIAIVCGINGVNGRETGFTRLPSRSGVDCPDTIRFRCDTTGRGRTLLRIGDETLFDFSHSEYEEGANTNESQLGGDISAGNLSRSDGMECSNMTDYCYTTFVVVRLTEQTLCRVITCTTTFRSDSDIIETDFGNSTATTITMSFPSTPLNLRMISRSESSITFAWDPGSPTCNTNYSVSVMNCGTCNQDSYISRTNITCDHLEPARYRQQMLCNITVQSVSECSVPSAPLTRLFDVSILESNTGGLNVADTAGDSVGGIVGGIIGGLILVTVAVILVMLVLLILWKKKERNQQSSDPHDQLDRHQAIEIDPSSNGKPEAVCGPHSALSGTSVSSVGIEDNQQPVPEGHRSDQKVLSLATSSGAQAAAADTVDQSLEQNQSKTSVSSVGIEDNQQPVPEGHQSDQKVLSLATSLGAQAAAADTVDQSLEQNQSKKLTPLDRLEAAASESDPQPSVSPKMSDMMNPQMLKNIATALDVLKKNNNYLLREISVLKLSIFQLLTHFVYKGSGRRPMIRNISGDRLNNNMLMASEHQDPLATRMRRGDDHLGSTSLNLSPTSASGFSFLEDLGSTTINSTEVMSSSAATQFLSQMSDRLDPAILKALLPLATAHHEILSFDRDTIADCLQPLPDYVMVTEEQLKNKDDEISGLKERLKQYENKEVTVPKEKESMPDK